MEKNDDNSDIYDELQSEIKMQLRAGITHKTTPMGLNKTTPKQPLKIKRKKKRKKKKRGMGENKTHR